MSARSLGSVVVAIQAVDEASGVMGKIQASLGLLGGALQNLGGGFAAVGTVIQGFAAGGVAGAAIGAFAEITKGLQESIKEATNSEAVFTSLGAAITRSGTAWDTVSVATKKALLAMQATTTYSDEELAAALERLMTFGLSYDDAMTALGKTLDFAAAKHMDLTSAATLVGKAMDGNTAILKRYGVDLETTKDQAAELKLAHDAAAGAIKALGKGVDDWVISVTAAIGADTTFENGLDASKDKAQYLIEQFKAGNIDLPEFTTAMQSLGVQLDEAKMKGGSAEEVLSKLNEQFGGAAQAQASTYAGIQERLKNATTELGEKIGGILLPALASLTEDMIPIMNDLGPIADGFGKWFSEITSAPDFKALGATIHAALSDTVKDFGDLTKSFGDTNAAVGDLLKSLGVNLPEGFSALNIVAKGFEMTWTMLVTAPLKETTLILQGLTAAFTAAADFIKGPIKSMTDAIGGFVQWMKDTFQGFYTWFVGGSLWMDLWTRVLAIASQMIGQLLADLGSKFFEPMKTAFTTVTDAVKRIWDTAWQAMQTTFTNISNAISAGWQTFLNAMQGAMSSFWSTLEGATAAAFGWLQASFTSAMWVIQGILSAAIGVMQSAFGFFWQVIQGAATTALWALQGIFTSGMGAIRGTLDAAIAGMEAVWTAFIGFMSQGLGQLQGILGSASASVASTVSSMQTVANSAVSQIQTTFSSAWGSIASGAEDLWKLLVGGSIWTDLMETMQSQAYSALGNIAGAFQDMSLAIPAAVPYSPTASSSPAGAPMTTPSFTTQQSITIPITVTLDGQVISRQVEQRIVERVNMRGKKAA